MVSISYSHGIVRHYDTFWIKQCLVYCEERSEGCVDTSIKSYWTIHSVVCSDNPWCERLKQMQLLSNSNLALIVQKAHGIKTAVLRGLNALANPLKHWTAFNDIMALSQSDRMDQVYGPKTQSYKIYI